MNAHNLRTLARYGRVDGMDLTETGLLIAKQSGHPLAI